MYVTTSQAKAGFYPTPPELASELLKDLDFRKIQRVLEPSAGTGNLIQAMHEAFSRFKRGNGCYYEEKMEVDCCEIDPALRGVLSSNFEESWYFTVRIVHDDFLTMRSEGSYDLILMNPPFADGDLHLLKAIAMQERSGGQIRCILNAETVRNLCTNRRKTLMQKLGELGATITYRQNAFANAERPTDVEVALISISVPAPELTSTIFEHCQKAVEEQQPAASEVEELVVSDKVQQIVTRYQVEVESGVTLIREYLAMKPYILSSVEKSKYNSAMIRLAVGNSNHADDEPNVNDYIKAVRKKYWSALFANRQFVGQLTSELQEMLRSRVCEMVNYEFSVFNIRCIMVELNAAMFSGVKDSIDTLFELLTVKYSYNAECRNANVHYYSGWKTNQAYKIGKKVILPRYLFPSYSWSKDTIDVYAANGFLVDIEKALNYLDGNMTAEVCLLDALNNANAAKQTKNIVCKYFTATFYKKGTVHLTFTCPDLIERFNIICGKDKNWLPPRYGRASYSSMSEEEKAVVDSFNGDGTEGSGEKAYKEIVERSGYFLAPPNSRTLALPA